MASEHEGRERGGMGAVSGAVTYGAEFDCPQCGERLFVSIQVDASGMRSEVLRARDIPPEEDDAGAEVE